MAVRFDTTTDKLSRTTNLPTAAAFTVMAWVYLTVDRNAFSSFFCYGPGAFSANWLYMGTTTDGLIWELGAAGGDTAGASLGLATWNHVAAAYNGTNYLGYLNGVLDITRASAAASTATTLTVGNSFTTDFMNGRMAAVKIWSATLTVDEVKTEMRQILPMRLANLNTFSPLISSGDVSNLAGTGVWTVAGTLTTEDGPPIPWSVAPVRRTVRSAPAPAVGKAPPPRVPRWRFARRVA